MNKKTLIDLAAGFKAQLSAASPEAVETIKESIRVVADVAARHNSNFDRARFMAACGLPH